MVLPVSSCARGYDGRRRRRWRSQTSSVPFTAVSHRRDATEGEAIGYAWEELPARAQSASVFAMQYIEYMRCTDVADALMIDATSLSEQWRLGCRAKRRRYSSSARVKPVPR